MGTRLYTNNYGSTIDGAITDVATTIVVTSASGLPTISGTDTYRLTLDDGAGNVEVVEVTAATTVTLTVTRGVDGTSGLAFADLVPIELRPTADGLQSSVTYTGETRAVDLGGATSLEIPNGAAPTVNAAGEIAVDTTVTDHTGLVTYHDGTEALYAVGLPVANLLSNDGYVIAYSASSNEFEMVAPGGGGGGATAFADLTDITITTDDSADDTSSYDNIRYLKSGDPLVTNGGMTLMAASSTTTRFYGWGGNASFPTPRMFANATTKYIGFNSSNSDPTILNGTAEFTLSNSTATLSNAWLTVDSTFAIRDSSVNEMLDIVSVASAVNQVKITNAATGNAPKIEASGTETNTNLELDAKGTGHIVATPGISFGAGTDVLDVYEEGSWTPIPVGSGTAGTMAGNFQGRYTRIGDLVFIGCALDFTSLSTAAGNLVVTAFPFAALASNVDRSAFSVSLRGNFTNDFPMTGFMNSGASSCTVRRMDIDGTDLQVADMSATTLIVFGGVYKI